MVSKEAVSQFQWYREQSQICFRNETEQFCGQEEPCSELGLILPILNESTWDWRVRAVLYLIGMFYSFLGVSIVSDLFMSAIEKITHKTKEISICSKERRLETTVLEIPVWNGTVANLTLMVLGTSAPEILLAIIRTIGNNFQSEKIGPSTIVGSAAFNLLAVSAFCICGVPAGETRRVKNIPVFIITAIFSIIAYLWLLIILVYVSKDEIEVWEALSTLVMFPVLVSISYIADRGYFDNIFHWNRKLESDENLNQLEMSLMDGAGDGRKIEDKNWFRNGRLDKEALVYLVRNIKMNTKLSDEDAAIVAASKILNSRPKSRMWYRINATRNLIGGRNIEPIHKMKKKLKKVYDAINEDSSLPNLKFPVLADTETVVEFHTSTVAVMENVGTFQVFIRCRGLRTGSVGVWVESIDGSAKEGEDYLRVDEILTFAPMETEKKIDVTILDDLQWEPDEEFFLKLSLLEDNDDSVKLGHISVMEVVIIDDDNPGTFQFGKSIYLVKESWREAVICVIRSNGADGEVTIRWRIVDTI